MNDAVDVELEAIKKPYRKDANHSGSTIEVAATLKALCVHDFLKLDIPIRKELLSPILRKQDIAMVHAWRGIGKTQFVGSLGLAISTGSAFLGWKAAAPHPVLYVDGEMPARTMQDRMKGFIAGAGKAPDPAMF